MHIYRNNIPGFWNSRCKGPEARMCLAVGVAERGWCGWNGMNVGGGGGKWEEIIPRR